MSALLATPLRLQLRGLGKSYGPLRALDDVTIDLRGGMTHGLVGGNGAGKSTLLKILAGAFTSYDGEISLGDETIALRSPQAAARHGIAMVYQELSGIGQLSVAENLFLGRQLTSRGVIRWAEMARLAEQYLRELGIAIDVRCRLDRFPLLVRQMVEIARGLHSGAQVLLLDEPTSALSMPETRRLFELIEVVKRRGVAVVFVSHFIEDVLSVCDQVTILRDGRLVETRLASEVDKSHVVHRMLGHDLSRKELGFDAAVRLPARTRNPALFRAENLTTGANPAPMSLEVAPGECVGLYGFFGAGHQHLVHALGGAVKAKGKLFVGPRGFSPGATHRAIQAGAVLVVADRAASLVHGAPIAHNVTLAHLARCVGAVLRPTRELKAALPALRTVGCRPLRPYLEAGALSGGNQQKVAIAKWLLGDIKVLLLDEPTRGMDVGAKEEVMRIVAQLKRQGAAIVVASCEPEFLLAQCDRILVMKRGQVVREFVDEAVDKADLVRSA